MVINDQGKRSKGGRKVESDYFKMNRGTLQTKRYEKKKNNY